MENLKGILPRHVWEKIEVCEESGCWFFKGKDPSSNGYIRTWYKGHRHMAHRLVYELVTGRDIRKWQLDHLCENRICCNPEHLDPVSCKVNNKRKFRRRKKYEG